MVDRVNESQLRFDLSEDRLYTLVCLSEYIAISGLVQFESWWIIWGRRRDSSWIKMNSSIYYNQSYVKKIGEEYETIIIAIFNDY